ncbi:MAG TPA: metallophosphoesterase family protein [Gaiellales bacterium]
MHAPRPAVTDAQRAVKIVVLSDVHSNLPALEAVLEAVEGEDASELWCLGDLVGYNADPEACTTTMVELADICLAGNHDLVVNGTVDISVFAHDAAIAARWAQEVLSDDALASLRTLEPSGERRDVELHHASPRDPIWEYVIDQRTAQSCLEILRHDICLIGHSHVPLAYTRGGAGRAEGGYAEPGTLELEQGRWLLNPGSVGQPRDGDPRAAYMVLDLAARTATWRRLEYDIERAQRAIVEAGLPNTLAWRLAEGR